MAVDEGYHRGSPFILPAVAGVVVRHTESLGHTSDVPHDTRTDPGRTLAVRGYGGRAMSDDDRDDRLSLFLRLLDTLARIEARQARRRDRDDAGDGTFGYDIVMGDSDSRPSGAGWLVTERRLDTGHLVVADVPGVDTRTVDVSTEDGILYFRVDGETVERVALPDRDADVVHRADTNGVLAVRVGDGDRCTRQPNG